jgi:outer membrane protein assembly factor BamB
MNDASTARTPLRLWPGVVFVTLQWLCWVVVPLISIFGPERDAVGLIGGILCGLAVAVWWLLASRAPWLERLAVLVLVVAGLMVTRAIVHPSIAGGMMGMLIYVYGIPVMCLAVVAGAVAGRRLPTNPRRAVMAAAILLGCGVFVLLRTDGTRGAGSQFAWRWSPTAEERLLAQVHDEPATAAVGAVPERTAEPAMADAKAADPAPTTPAPEAPGEAASTAPAAPPANEGKLGAARAVSDPTDPPVEWPGFRGAGRDGVVRGVAIETDWSKNPPAELWRRPVGPGWSSFAVHGGLIYTQEQRGEDEIVAAYRLSTGEPVWRHRDRVRFYESNGGAGPRGTPTVHRGRVYAMGATGLLNALDARTGVVIWSRDVANDTATDIPDWGFSSSPLVFDDEVVVAASGTLAAYELATGAARWVGPRLRGSYSSPHRATFDGVPQVLLLGASGAASVAPKDGALLWNHEWAGGTPIVQPAMIPGDGLLVNSVASTGGLGLRRLAVTHDAQGWTAEERWTSSGLKPYFNDFVVHEGHAFGFDGNILSCISLEDGARKWKGGRYGNGQMVLLADQDLLLVLSEDGELALVSATPDRYQEVARFTALHNKTWNHPVLAGNVLLVRNGEEMAAFRLPAGQ